MIHSIKIIDNNICYFSLLKLDRTGIMVQLKVLHDRQLP